MLQNECSCEEWQEVTPPNQKSDCTSGFSNTKRKIADLSHSNTLSVLALHIWVISSLTDSFKTRKIKPSISHILEMITNKVHQVRA